MRCMCDVCAAHEELVAASKQFRRSRGEKSTRLGLVALTVGPVHIRMRIRLFPPVIATGDLGWLRCLFPFTHNEIGW